MPTCPVCHGQYALAELDCPKHKMTDKDTKDTLSGKVCRCPRCQTDIYSWRSEVDQITPILKQPYPLIVPFLAPVLSVGLWITIQRPLLIGSLMAIVLSISLFFSLGNATQALRIAQHARSFKMKPGLTLDNISLLTFLAGLTMALMTLILVEFWILPPADSSFVKSLLTSLAYGLSFPLITAAATITMIESQIVALDKIMPQPVFTNTTLLLRIVMNSTKRQLNLRDDPTIENVERTDDAGIRIVVSRRRKVTSEEKKKEKVVSTKRQGKELETSENSKEEEKTSQMDEKGSLARWEIRADKWGRIRSIDVHDWWTFVEA